MRKITEFTEDKDEANTVRDYSEVWGNAAGVVIGGGIGLLLPDATPLGLLLLSTPVIILHLWLSATRHKEDQ